MKNVLCVRKAPDRSVVISREFSALRERVYEALTRPEAVLEWFQSKQMALVSFEADVRVGGSFGYVFERPSGKRMEMRGTYNEVDAPARWVYTESYDFSPLELQVTNELREAAGITTLRQTILYGSAEECEGDFEAVQSSAEDLYTKLETYLESH